MRGTNPQFRPVNKCLRVLIADDNQDAADSLAFLVRIWGHDARVAYDGEAALALARRFRPQVALLDIGMPRMDGYELCRRMRGDRRLAESVLIALTAYSDEETLSRGRAAGFDHHLVKPAEPARVQLLLNQVRGASSGVADADIGESSARLREIDFPTATGKPAPFPSRLGSGPLPSRTFAGRSEGGYARGK